MIVNVPTRYYRQFDADYSLDVPAEAFAGWTKKSLPFDLSRTAIVSMHAADCGSQEKYPGWYRAVEYLPRAAAIARDVFPVLLGAARACGMKVYHVPMGERMGRGFPGYARAVRLAGTPAPLRGIAPQPWVEELRRFRREQVAPGGNNGSDIEQGLFASGFYPGATPQGEEGVAENAEQLLALCLEDGIDHLIYIGFAINWCLLKSPGGMIDMAARGVLCSTVPAAVTAVERRETARAEQEKASALWRVSLDFGFVFELEDLLGAFNGGEEAGQCDLPQPQE